MRNRILLLAFSVAFLLLFVSVSTARTNDLLNIQGKLTDNNGALQNGTFTFQFRLYTASTGGTSIWHETQSVNVSNGIFNAYLGSNLTLENVTFDRPYWLGATVGSDSEMTPRIQLGSSPYSFRSNVTDYLEGGVNATGTINITTGGVLIFGSDTNIYRSAANVLKTDDSLIVGGSWLNVTGSNGLNVSGSAYIGGNVGINTTSPNSKLEIVGTTTALNISTVGSGVDAVFQTTSNNAFDIYFGSNSTTVGSIQASGSGFYILGQNNYDLYLYDDSSNGIIVKDGGSVGIGTTSPSQKLEVVGNISITGTNALNIYGASGNITFGNDTNIYRSAANVLKTDDSLIVGGSWLNATNVELGAGVISFQGGDGVGGALVFQSGGGNLVLDAGNISGGANVGRLTLRTAAINRLDVIGSTAQSQGSGMISSYEDLNLTDQQLLFGASGSAADTNLYRSAANELKTDDTFNASVLVSQDIKGIAATRSLTLYGASAGQAGLQRDIEFYTQNAGADVRRLLIGSNAIQGSAWITSYEPLNVFGQINGTRITVNGSDVITIANSSAGSQGLVGYWTLDEGNGDNAYDASGYSNTGALTGMTQAWNSKWNSTDCRYGSCLKFEGTDDFVSITDPGTSSLDLGGSMTLSGWFKFDTVGVAGFVSKRNSAGSQVNYLLRYASGFDFNIRNTSGTNQGWTFSWTPVTNRWYFVAVTYDDSSKAVRGYVDASNIGSATAVGSPATDNQPVRIGSDDGGSGYLNGTADEVKVYNRALSADEIKAEYLAGSSKHEVTLSAKNLIAGGWVNATQLNVSSGLFVNGSGFVGIGTVNPTSLLHLDSTGSTAIRIGRSAGGGASSRDWAFVENWNAEGDLDIIQSNAKGGDPLVAGTSRLTIDPSGDVGIGDTTPGRKLEITGGSIQLEGENGIFWWNSPNNDNAGMGYINFTGGSVGGRILFGTNAAERMRIDENGNVGIGTTTANADLNISDGASACSYINAGATAFTACSSRDIKENIAPFKVSGILDRIASVPVSSFDFINGSKDRIGLIAEDFYPVLRRGDGRTVDGQDVQMALWLAVQQLTKNNNALKSENTVLKSQLGNLESRVASLEAK